MKKVPNVLSGIVAILFIIIGLVHTEVHFRELDNAKVQLRLTAIDDLQLLGQPANIWKLWQGFSFMMGICFLIIGILRLLSIQTKNLKNQLIGAFTMVFLLIVVIISGRLFFSAFQIYGGLLGLLLQLLGIIFLVKSRRQTS
ncbi:MAG: hypothetical protein AAF620_13705 [Bacteroidota bacterium]